MFKKYLLAISLLALSSGTTLAANPIAKLKVTGRIKPPTCTINNEEQKPQSSTTLISLQVFSLKRVT